MNRLRMRLRQAASFPALVGLFFPIGVAFGLVGCAGNQAPVAAAPEAFTESDEPEARKRATNRLKLAVLYYQDGKYNFALDEIKQAILTDPNWYELYGMRGLIQMQSGDYPQAEVSLQKALSIRPNASDLKHNYGVLLCKMKRPDAATRQFDAALADPAYGQRAKTWEAQGRCQQEYGQDAQAEASFMRAYELDSGNTALGFSLAALLLQRGDLPRAQFYARRVNNTERATAESLWLGIKIERSLGTKDAQQQLESQLRKRFAQSREAMALERGAFNE